MLNYTTTRYTNITTLPSWSTHFTLKFFNILEDEDQCLDLKIAEKNGESLSSVLTNIRPQIKNIYSSIEDRSGGRRSCKCGSASS